MKMNWYWGTAETRPLLRQLLLYREPRYMHAPTALNVIDSLAPARPSSRSRLWMSEGCSHIVGVPLLLQEVDVFVLRKHRKSFRCILQHSLVSNSDHLRQSQLVSARDQ